MIASKTRYTNYTEKNYTDGKDLVNKNVLSCLLKDGKEVNAVMLVGTLFHARATGKQSIVFGSLCLCVSVCMAVSDGTSVGQCGTFRQNSWLLGAQASVPGVSHKVGE